MKPQRLTINIPASTMQELKDLASMEQASLTEIVRRAISAELFLFNELKQGNKILIQEKGKSQPTRVMVFR